MLTLLPTYLSYLKTLSSVEQLQNLKYLSFSCKTEDLLMELLSYIALYNNTIIY